MSRVSKLIILFFMVLLAVVLTATYKETIFRWTGMYEAIPELPYEDLTSLPDEEEVSELETTPIVSEKEPAKNPHIVDGYDKNNLESRIAQGRYYLANNFFEFALDEGKGAINLEPDNPLGYLFVAEVQDKKREYKYAANSLKRAIELGQNDFATLSAYVRALLKAGESTQAYTEFSAYDNGSTDPQVVYLRGLFGVMRGDRGIAGGSFKYLVDNHPNTEWQTLAQRFIDAYWEFDLFQDGRPEHLQALLAKVANENGEYYIAKEVLLKSTKDNPKYRDAWVVLGYTYYALEDYKSAQSAWQTAVTLDPTHAEARYFLGLAQAQNKNYADALESFEFAQKNGFEPRSQIVNKLAGLYLEQKNYQEALKNYKEYLTLGGDVDPDNYVRPVWIALEYLGEINTALELSEQAIAKHSNSAMAYNLLGWSAIYNKDYPKAHRALSRAQELDPKMAAVYLNFGLLYMAQGENDEAREYFYEAYYMDEGGSIGNQAARHYNELIKLLR